MKLAKFKTAFIGIGIIVGAIVVVSLLISFKPKPEEEETTKPPFVVKTTETVVVEQTVSSTFQGEVRAKTDIELVTQVAGKVKSVSSKFTEGGQFLPGETLLQIDEADFRVALKSAEASVAAAQVDLDIEMATAATNAKEWQELQGKPIEEANPLRLNKPQIDRAKARLDAAKAELAAAQLNYDRTKISAPFAGRIMTKSAELGQFMARGASIGRVFATDAMEIRIPMTDVQVSELGLSLGYSAAENGGVVLPAKVSVLFGASQREWPGYLKSVDASIDNETRLLFATVVVEQPFAHRGEQSVPLVPGLFVDVELASPQNIVGIKIPRTALRNGNQLYLYEDEKLRLESVSVIFTSAEFVIIENVDQAGRLVGKKVITSSVPGAHDGMSVVLPESLEPDSVIEESSDAVSSEAEPMLEKVSEQDGRTEDQTVEQNELVTPESTRRDLETSADVQS